MLVPLIIKLLIAALVLTLAGWINDILHASIHKGPDYLDSEDAGGWDQMTHRRKVLPGEEPNATLRVRPTGRHRPLARRPWHPLAIERLRPRGLELRRCHDSAT